MTRVAIIGGNGFIGSSIARNLAEKGHWVATLSRSSAASVPGSRVYYSADRNDPSSIEYLCTSERIDTVIDLLAMVVAPTTRLLDALDGVVGRYVIASSLDVYRNYGGFHGVETPDPILEPLTEDSPLRTSRFPYRGSPAAQVSGSEWLGDYDKILVEDEVRRLRRTDWTILRLPMVFGPGDRQYRFRVFTQPFSAGAPTLELPTAWARWKTTYGYVDNVAAAIALASVSDRSANQIYNVGEETPVDHIIWAHRFADAAGWSGEIAVVDESTSPLAAIFARADCSFPMMVDSSKVRSELGFRDIVSMEEAVRRTYEHDLKFGWAGQGGA